MSCDTGDVCLSRVGVGGFNEHLVSHSQAPRSLLTFADMVLALDNRNIDDEMKDSSNRENLQDDHNYASNKLHKMTTRSQSQAMRINRCSENPYYHFGSDSKGDDAHCHKCLSNSDPGGIGGRDSPRAHSPSRDRYHSSHITHKETTTSVTSGSNYCGGCCYQQELVSKVKRSSSVENVNSEPITTDSFSEWPPTARKNSPRKSCSFEEVNKTLASVTGYRKSDDRKGGSSGQLHRLVNDTLECPCWPRKADHTYATATWDGTAASHSIFEQEMNQIDARTEDFKMDITEAYVLPLKKRSFNQHFDEHLKSVYRYQQKDDHTYVKPNHTNSSLNNFPAYSCSTFPRQKSRDDHTYFSSGFNKHGSSSSGKDWKSVHTVTNLSPHAQSKDRNEVSGNRNAPDIVSAKKDHNYFTSAR